MSANRILMIAYHFPPLAGSSGIQRTLRFAQQLQKFGWSPVVLSVKPLAYERTSSDLLPDVPDSVPVYRAWGLDTARHLSLGGKYLGALARPDRWMTWQFDAVRLGLQLVKRYRPRFVWSTYPIATAHVIGAMVSERAQLPWVADFRDPMAQEGYPADPLTWQQFRDIEARAMQSAVVSTFTTPGAARAYAERYPHAAQRIQVLENGYDEETFAASEVDTDLAQKLTPGATTILHSGIVYPDERDPTQLMHALRKLLDRGALRPGMFSIRFRAPAQVGLLQQLAQKYGVADLIEIAPPIPYKEALSEMLRADGLLLLQASNCNEQIPAKLYEYLRARRPIICLSDPQGDTVRTLQAAGVNRHAELSDADAIADLLSQFVQSPDHREFMPEPQAVPLASRLNRSAELAGLLDRLLVAR